MKKIVLSAVLITSLLSSCNNNKTENNGPQTFHIDLNATDDKADKLYERMEMRLLPLESNAHSIFNDESAKMHVKGNTMIVGVVVVKTWKIANENPVISIKSD